MKSVVWLGALLALLGILGLAIPDFTASETKDVVKLDGLKIQNTERTTYEVPVSLSASALVLGIVLMGAGLYRRTPEV